MKKVLTVLFVLLALTTVAFAKQGFTLRGGFSYDLVNIKVPSEDNNGVNWKANAFGAEVGVTYNFTDKFLAYYDTTLGFYSTFKLGEQEVKKEDYEKTAFLSSANHAGVAYSMDMKNGLELAFGAGLAMEYARIAGWDVEEAIDPIIGKKVSMTESDEFGIVSLGFGLYANVGYAFSDKLSVSATVHPDFMIFSSLVANESKTYTLDDKTSYSESQTFTYVGTGTSVKVNASVGLTFKF